MDTIQPTIPAQSSASSRRWWVLAIVGIAQLMIVLGLPRQLVHGDFWDDNVFFRGETLVFVADFAFMAVRARIDDLALTLYYADTEFGLPDREDRIAALRPLVHSYPSRLDHPLTGPEREALPWAVARQPLWGIGGWVAVLDDQDTARVHARATFPALQRAFQLVTDIGSWQAGLS